MMPGRPLLLKGSRRGRRRVEEWRGGVGEALRVGRPFRLPVPEYPTMLRFHSPLVEPDVQIARIRLSDKDSCGRTRKTARSARELEQPVGAAQVGFRVA
jgi:hypothetical protein